MIYNYRYIDHILTTEQAENELTAYSETGWEIFKIIGFKFQKEEDGDKLFRLKAFIRKEKN